MHLNYTCRDTFTTHALALLELTCGTTSGTDSWPSLILLSLLNPKGWRQEVNPQVMVTFSRGDLLKNASGRLCCRMAKWAGGFSADTRRTSKASGLQNSSREQSATKALNEFWDITDSVFALPSSGLPHFHPLLSI